MDLTNNKSRIAMQGSVSKPLHFIKLREATDRDYSVYRCAGTVGCGERITADHVAEHAAKQHSTYDYDRDTEVKKADA